jgi:hypothetical protein
MDSFGQTNPVAGFTNILTRISETGEKLNIIHRKHIELLPDILQNPILYQIIHKTLKLLKMYFELQIRFNKKVRDKASNYAIIKFYFDTVDIINQMYLKKIVFIYEIVDSASVERYNELPPYLLNDMEGEQSSKTLFDNVKNFLTGLALNNVDFLQEQLNRLKEMAQKKLSNLKEGSLDSVENDIKENIEIVADKLEEKITELNDKIEEIDKSENEAIRKSETNIEEDFKSETDKQEINESKSEMIEKSIVEESPKINSNQLEISKTEDDDSKKTSNNILTTDNISISKSNQKGGNITFNKIYDPVYSTWVKTKSVRGINLLSIYYKKGYIF